MAGRHSMPASGARPGRGLTRCLDRSSLFGVEVKHLAGVRGGVVEQPPERVLAQLGGSRNTRSTCRRSAPHGRLPLQVVQPRRRVRLIQPWSCHQPMALRNADSSRFTVRASVRAGPLRHRDGDPRARARVVQQRERHHRRQRPAALRAGGTGRPTSGQAQPVSEIR